MKKQLDYAFYLTLPCFLLVFSLLSACESPDTASTRENVCKLSSGQIPKIRGLQLGMLYKEVEKIFPDTCTPYSKYEYSRRLILRVWFDSYVKPDCEVVGGLREYHLSLQKHPDFSGVRFVELSFLNGKLTWLKILYDRSKDDSFPEVFRRTIKESLGLSAFTNWGKLDSSEYFSEEQTKSDVLLCNKVMVTLKVVKFTPRDKEVKESYGIFYDCLLEMNESDGTALTLAESTEETEQKAKQATEANRQKQNKEKEKTNSFAP